MFTTDTPAFRDGNNHEISGYATGRATDFAVVHPIFVARHLR